MSDTQLSIPEHSQIHETKIKFDYSDAYSHTVRARTTIEQVALAFLKNTPEWLIKLTVLKDKVVKSYQQKNNAEVENSEERFRHYKMKVGEQVGHFEIIYKSEEEIIFARKNKSIDVNISLMFLGKQDSGKSQKQLVMSTVMQVNNWWGKMTMVPLKPFHQEMAPFILENIAEEIARDQTTAVSKSNDKNQPNNPDDK